MITAIFELFMNFPIWIWQYNEWPHFCWNNDVVIGPLASVKEKQGLLIGMMSSLGFDTQNASSLDVMTEEVLRNSEIEGLMLNPEHVRSSVARHLGISTAGMPEPDHYTEGVVQVLLDAVQHASEPLTEQRLFNWHAALFPTGRSGMTPITVASWRVGDEPMQVVNGPMGKEKIHYEAPPSADVPQQMKEFIQWFNQNTSVDSVLKAATAHLWFINIHPFDDGNGRITRTITDMQLSRADRMPLRFYSMSAAILRNKKSYYDILEYTGKHGLDITQWILWFLQTMEVAIDTAIEKTQSTIKKSLFWQEMKNLPLNERQIKIINRLWDGFEGKLNTSKYAKITKTSDATALRDIQDLVSKGILIKGEGSGRSAHYLLAAPFTAASH